MAVSALNCAGKNVAEKSNKTVTADMTDLSTLEQRFDSKFEREILKGCKGPCQRSNLPRQSRCLMQWSFGIGL